ncbi:odorant receptor 131-2-like [Neosynchiropus ocellatus]
MVSNSSVAAQLQGELERIMVSVFTGVPCTVFLTINAIILFTLRSKQVFRETSRYVLLTNLLVADSLYMMISEIMYIIANSRVFLTYPVCGALVLYAMLTDSIFPLTLAVMSVERYVAVCFPLFPFEELDSLHMRTVCDTFAVVLTPAAAMYDRVYNIFLFSFAGLTIISSLVAVMSTARSASADKRSARKAQSTLLLHMIQLVLGLSSTISIPVVVALFQVMSWVSFVRMMIVIYVLVFLLPRCLSSLIYGLRDQTIRPVLLSNLCCGLKPGVKTQISH